MGVREVMLQGSIVRGLKLSLRLLDLVDLWCPNHRGVRQQWGDLGWEVCRGSHREDRVLVPLCVLPLLFAFLANGQNTWWRIVSKVPPLLYVSLVRSQDTWLRIVDPGRVSLVANRAGVGDNLSRPIFVGAEGVETKLLLVWLKLNRGAKQIR